MKKIIVFAALILTNLACKKTTVDKVLTKTELLGGTKSKTWLGSAATAALTPSNASFDLFAVLPVCETDDIMIIYPTKIVENKEGNTKCDSKGSDIKNSSKWVLSSDEKSITVDRFIVTIPPLEKLEFANQKLDIVELTVSTLKLQTKFKYKSQDVLLNASFIAK